MLHSCSRTSPTCLPTVCFIATALRPPGGRTRLVIIIIIIIIFYNKRLRSTFCTIEANYWQTRRIARPLCDSRAACSVTVDNDTRLQAYITHFYQLHFTVLPLWRIITVWPTCSRDSMYCMYTLLSFIVGIVKELQKNKPLSLQWGRCQHRVFVSYHQTKFLSPRHACLPSVTRVSYDWLVGSRQNVDNLLAVLQKHFNEMH